MSAKTIISIRGLEKTFPSDRGLVRAVNKIDLDVAENEFVVLLGPSGCGKTTTLRCVAGLEQPDVGTIEIAGELVNSVESGDFVPPERRNIGMVFQSYAVWPHLNVYQNVALPLTDGRQRLPKSQVQERVMESLNLVQLDNLETRPVTDLSGGQQQRVALARAIVTKPMVLLMDEPLSNLDARLREEMRLELKKIATSAGVTSLYVTHDQAEALSLGDKICVMDQGEIQQVGPPEDVYSKPSSHFVAEFVGEMNFVKGKVTGTGQVDSALGLRSLEPPPGCQVGSDVTLAIRPQHLDITQNPDQLSQFPEGTILSKTYLGDSVLFEVDVSGVVLVVKLPGESNLTIGQRATVVLPADHWHIYP
ncbi:ABC transporter ATP-binding protein [Alphaproteobacteria bacterium]|nr:ABC transporter ATP-binding protein [Alphaproteobacteria bacterium]